MATVWMGMVHNIVVYEAAAGLMALGFSAWDCLAIVGVAYAILFLAMWLNARAGTRYGIPFCVLIRSAFGPNGAQIPVVLRGFCAIFWFSVQAYAATCAIDAVLGTLWPRWLLAATPFIGMSEHRWGAAALVWALHAWIMGHGVSRIRNFELVAGPAVILVGLCSTIWGLRVGHGLGPLFSIPSRLHGWAYVTAFAGGVTGMIGLWATFAVNIPDLSRFVRSEREQIIGQAIGLPVTALVFTPMAIITTSATTTLFGKPIWNPVDLLVALNHPAITIFGGSAIVLATLSVNTVANIVPACYDIINLAPKALTFARAAPIVMTAGLLFAPWLWFDDASSIFASLSLISGLLGPVTGIMLADFYIVRRQKLYITSLYQRQGLYEGWHGFSWAALLALLVGGCAADCGVVFSSLARLNAIAWFIGIAVGGSLYALFAKRV